MIETAPAPGVSPPLHQHDFDEAFYVMAGELTFRLRDEIVTAGPGELVFAPRGVPHTYANLSDVPARQLIVPMGDGGQRLHEWAFRDDERDRAILSDRIASIGAVIAGRRTYDDSVPWWGPDGADGSRAAPGIRRVSQRARGDA